MPSSKGHTTASAEAMMKKWGENEIPEEKEPSGPRRGLQADGGARPEMGAAQWGVRGAAPGDFWQ